MLSFLEKYKLIFALFGGFWVLGAFGQDPSLKNAELEISFQLPLNVKQGMFILQTKRSGVKSELELEVGALEKIVSPAGGVLIYSGWLSSSSNGFIISHNNKYISIVASPLSFEKVENLKFGEILTKGQVIATMRGGVSDVERSLKWSLFSIDDDKLISEIEHFISNQKPGDYSFVQTLMNKVIDQKKINIKNILEMGTLQFNFSAADKLDHCEVVLSGVNVPCSKADNYDYLLPERMYKVDILSGRFFKTTITSNNLVSKGDTVIQDIGKDDSGNFFAGAYSVERSDEYWASKNIINDFYAANGKLNAISKLDPLDDVDKQDNIVLTELQQNSENLNSPNKSEERQRIAAEAAQAALLQAQRQEEQQKAQAAEEERQKVLALAESKRRREAEERQRIAAEAAQAALLQAQRQEEQQKAQAAEEERQKVLALAESKRRREAEERQRIAAEAAQAALLQAQRQEEQQKAQAAEEERQKVLALAESKRRREAEERQRIAAEAAQAALLQAQRLAELEREKLQRIAALDLERNRSQIIKTNRKALIMGNDEYKDVPTLMNARSDARSMSGTLNKLGFEVSTHFDLSERGMKDAIRNFKSKVNGGDEVVVYFAGHGVQLGATNYLLPVDIRGQSEDQVKDEAIPLQRLLDDLQDTKARFALAIIDACRDNPFKNTGRSIGGRGLTSTSAVTGQMVMFSAGTGQQALDRLGPNDKEPNGLFTRILLQEIQKPGVPIERIVRNVRNEVAKLSRSVGHEQVPAVYDQTLGDFFFYPAKD